MIPYLSGSESATADKINAIVEAFDGKLAKILGNKSFILAFNAGLRGINPDLMGRCFFFTDGVNPSKWAFRCPDARVRAGSYITTDPATGLPTGIMGDAILYTYRHEIFTNAVQQVLPTLNPTYDDGRLTVEIDAFPAGSYADGITSITNMGLLDRSLQAHRVPHYDADGNLHYYWVKERQVGHMERGYRYAVAEIILEGQTDVSIPDFYDKYDCFRIHNLNYAGATVSFGKSGGRRVSLAPMECKTVRRDRTELENGAGWSFSNYRVGTEDYPARYFWKHVGGIDYRHYWFFATSLAQFSNSMTHDQPTPMNGMCANNLCNPSLILDWTKELKFDQSFIDQGTRYAWFYQDVHEVNDESAHYAGKLGDASNGATKFGDLVHHPGEMLKVKTHKRDPFIYGGVTTPYARTEVVSFQFNGYDTLVADFAAQGISVTPNANGTYTFTQTAETADWIYSLIPYGTNLFKVSALRETAQYWAEYPSLIDLTVPRELEIHVFDDQAANPGMNQRAPVLVLARNLTSSANDKVYQDETGQNITRVGPPTVTMTEIIPSGLQKPLWALQSVKVSDLLDLSYWGNKDLASQDTIATQYVDKRLVVGPHGLVLLFEEQIPAKYLRSVSTWFQGDDGRARYFFAPDQEWQLVGGLANGFFRRKRAIKLRGHGFGWPELGRSHSMWWSHRYGRHIYDLSESYIDENVARKDFSFGDLPTIETDVKILKRIRHDPDLMNAAQSGRFWKMADAAIGNRTMTDAFLGLYYQRKRVVPGTDDWFAFWLATPPHKLDLKTASAGLYQMQGWASAPPLLPEHYNGLAQSVNALKTGKQLDFTCLRFLVDWRAHRYAMGVTPPTAAGTTFFDNPNMPNALYSPVPTSCWKMFYPTFVAQSEVLQREIALYEQAGIRVRTEKDFPEWDDQSAGVPAGALPVTKEKVRDRVLTFKTDVQIQNLHNPDGGEDDLWFVGASKLTLSLESNTTVDYVATPPTAGREQLYPDKPGTALFPDNARRVLGDFYAGVKWVKIDDVKAWLAIYDFPFVYDEYFAPLELKRLRLGSKMVDGPKMVKTATTVEGRVFHWLTTTGANYSYTESYTLAEAELLAFVPAETSAKAKWKVPIYNFFDGVRASVVYDTALQDVRYWDQAAPMYGIKHSGVTYAQHETTVPGQFRRSFEARAFGFGRDVTNGQASGQDVIPSEEVPVNWFMTYGYGTVAGPHYHWYWQAASADENEAHDAWVKRCFGLTKTIGFQSHVSGNLSSRPNVLLIHDNFWSFEHDWVVGSLDRLFRGKFQAQFAPIFPVITRQVTPTVTAFYRWGFGNDGFNSFGNHPPKPISREVEKLAAVPQPGVNVYTADAPGDGQLGDDALHGSTYRLQIIRPYTTIEL